MFMAETPAFMAAFGKHQAAYSSDRIVLIFVFRISELEFGLTVPVTVASSPAFSH
jgi:hypothetical protein